MINSTSSFERSLRTEAATTVGGPARPTAAVRDQFSAHQAEVLRAALQQHPEIRPEIVARGRELAGDPSYPPPRILSRVASTILASPDQSEG